MNSLFLVLSLIGCFVLLPATSSRTEEFVRLAPTRSAVDGTTDDTTALREAIHRASPSGTVAIAAPVYIRAPREIAVPSGVSIVFSGEGRLVLAFGSLQRIRTTAHGTGYLSVPTVGIEGSAKPGAVTMGLSQFRLAAPGSGYRPGDELTLQGGSANPPARLTVAATQVIVAAVAAGGNGGADGSHVVSGTTGKGAPFEARVAIVGGRIVAVQAVTRPGTYTANPANPAAEPVVGAGLAGAALRLEMGVGSTMHGKNADNPTVYVSEFGSYTSLPVGVVALTGGNGQGAALRDVTWQVQTIGVVDGGRYAGTIAPAVTILGKARFAARAEAIGESITIDGKVIAGAHQVFAGYRRVAGHLGGGVVEAAWFGTDPTGQVDSTEALRAWAAAVPSPGGSGHCAAGTYLVSGTILQRSATTLACEGATSVWKAAATFTGMGVPAYTFPFASIDNTMIANENYDVPFHPTDKVDRDMVLRAITFDYSAPSAKRVPGNKAMIYRMVRNAAAIDLRCAEVGNCTTMMASDTTRVIRLVARGVSNAGADHWESPRNALVEDADIDLAGDPFGRTLYGVLFTGSDTAMRFSMGGNNTVRGGRITGFADAALWSDWGIEATSVEGALIDCRGHRNAVGIYITGAGGGHKVDGVKFRNCSRPVVFTNQQRNAWPRDIAIIGVDVAGQRMAPPFALNGTPALNSAIAPTLRAQIGGTRVRYAADDRRPAYSVRAGTRVEVVMRPGNSIDPGQTGIMQPAP